MSSGQRIVEQLAQTNALLDRYVEILARTDATAKLIFEERWRGAEEVRRPSPSFIPILY